MLYISVLMSSMLFSQESQVFHAEANVGNQSKGVTHYASTGRLGDQLLAYLHSKWISYRYGIPFMYQPFDYSDRLVLHTEEILYTTKSSCFSHVIVPRFRDVIDYDIHAPGTLYNIQYFSESPWELLVWGSQWYTFSVDWKDPIFRKEVQRLISPRSPIALHEIPKDRISVALHLRLGGGFDPLSTVVTYPAKFPPHDYYIEQLKMIYTLFHEQPLYVYLFTDDQQPLDIVRIYQRQLLGLDIQFACREKNNHHTKNVIEDFFAMMQYDCLIRPDSNFSLVAGRITDYKVIISPVLCSNQNGQVHIDTVLIEKSEQFLQMEQNLKGSL